MSFMDFSLSINDTKVKDFADKLREGKVMGTKCKVCGGKYYPPSADCCKCFSSEMEWFEMTSLGHLITYTKIYVLPEHFADHFTKAPFSKYTLDPCPVGIIEVEDGLRVMGWMPKMSLNEIKIGMPLRITAEILEDGKVVIVFKAA
ncbi:MAG: Zn-ribbon domain-containing OB-fold protein [Pseudomonadota bacterium]